MPCFTMSSEVSEKTFGYCWRTYCHAIQPQVLRWILQCPVPSTTAYARHNFRYWGGGARVSAFGNGEGFPIQWPHLLLPAVFCTTGELSMGMRAPVSFQEHF